MIVLVCFSFFALSFIGIVFGGMLLLNEVCGVAVPNFFAEEVSRMQLGNSIGMRFSLGIIQVISGLLFLLLGVDLMVRLF